MTSKGAAQHVLDVLALGRVHRGVFCKRLSGIHYKKSLDKAVAFLIKSGKVVQKGDMLRLK